MIELTFTITLENSIKQQELTKIFKNLKVFNTKNNITGQFIAYDQKIVCIVEGNAARVGELFFKTQLNNHFSKVKFMGKWDINQRQFNTTRIFFDKENNLPKEQKPNFFENNLKYLMLLVDNNTCGSVTFWNTIENLLEENGVMHNYAYETIDYSCKYSMLKVS